MYFKIALWMITYRTYFRRLSSYHNMSAVTAFPYLNFTLFKYLCSFNILKKCTISFFMMLLTAGVTSALTYYGADVSVAQNDSNVVTASAQGAQAGDTAQETAQTPTAAQTCGYTNLGMSVISSGNLNIRQEASTDSEVIGILTNHNACELLEDAGEWYKVTSGKVTGYVNKQYLVTGDEAEAIAEQEIKTVATVNTETLNVRAEKSTEAAVLSQVGNSEAFTVNSVADGWVEISVDAPYYFITDYMQSYLHDYDSGTYIEIEGEAPYDTNAQIMWDKEAEIKAGIEAEDRTTMENDNGEYSCDLAYGEHKLHLTATLLDASEGQLEKGIGYLFGIREIAEKIPGFLPDIQ